MYQAEIDRERREIEEDPEEEQEELALFYQLKGFTEEESTMLASRLAEKPEQFLRTLAHEGDARFKAIEALIQEWTPDALVIGVPFHPDGAEHDNTARARRFGS